MLMLMIVHNLELKDESDVNETFSLACVDGKNGLIIRMYSDVTRGMRMRPEMAEDGFA